MATIKLSLSPKNDKKTGKSAILMRFVGGRNFIFRAKTGFYIKPENWSTENDAPKKLGRMPTAVQRWTSYGHNSPTLKAGSSMSLTPQTKRP